MYCAKKLTGSISWIGGNDRRISLFENVYPVPHGVSYNSYFVRDEQNVVVDTVDRAVRDVFFENIAHLLQGGDLHWLIVNHMEPDHAATIEELALRYPSAKIVCNAKIAAMMKQFFTFDVDSRVHLVKEGDTLCTGSHTFTFVMAPMVHWPEVMMTYETTEKALFSADAFGSFGALDGGIFADHAAQDQVYMDEARRYYTNIVGKYGSQVQAVLKKAAGLDIALLCPLHGYVWRRNIGDLVEKYAKWSGYTPEDRQVLIAYASVYGHTENAAEIIASRLAEQGVRSVLYDVSVTHPSYIVAEAFRCSHIVFASTTYNAGIFVNMENLLHDIAAHNLQNRTVAFVENGSWAPTAGKLMREILSPLKNMTFLDTGLTLRSSLKEDQLAQLQALADAVAASIREQEEAAQPKGHKPAKGDTAVDSAALRGLTYGLFVLTARDGDKDNGCIINTVQQVTGTPLRVSIAVNKENFTHDMIARTGLFNVSVLATSASMDLFKHFGFQSGRDTEKLANWPDDCRSENGLCYIPGCTNAFISAKVVNTVDCGTHTLFIADVTEARKLSGEPSVTYQYYFDHIKPKPPVLEKKKGFVCKICGYIYEGDELPADFVCPLCKHGPEDFEPLA